jgi:hypothetical protein
MYLFTEDVPLQGLTQLLLLALPRYYLVIKPIIYLERSLLLLLDRSGCLEPYLSLVDSKGDLYQ